MSDEQDEGAPDSIRAQYVALGVEGFYSQHGAHYKNPHEDDIERAIGMALSAYAPDTSRVLDMACGSGEVTRALVEHGVKRGAITACDPYTGEAYVARCGGACEPWSFEEIAQGALGDEIYTLVVCCFALHLCPDSWLPRTCLALAQSATELWVITPHKRPDISPGWGWRLDDEFLYQRVRVRRYVL
jgi:SAM-dependent methyltransferase